MGSIENALYADKLDAEGNLWVPDEADPTLDRSACHISSCILPTSVFFFNHAITPVNVKEHRVDQRLAGSTMVGFVKMNEHTQKS